MRIGLAGHDWVWAVEAPRAMPMAANSCAIFFTDSPCSIRVVQLPLVAQGKHPDLVPGGNETIQGDVSRGSVGDDELAQIAFHAPADQRMARQQFDGSSNGDDRVERVRRVVLRAIFEQTLQVRERVSRIDYLRQGLGRAAFPPEASRSIQA